MMSTPIRKQIILLVVALSGFLMPMAGMAQHGKLVGTEKLGDARMLAMGGALRASSSNSSAVYINPAAMGMDHVYHINVKYQYTGLDNLHNGGIVLMDSITSETFAGGLSLDYLRTGETDSDFTSWDGRLAASLNIKNLFFLGVTARYLRAAQDIAGPPSGMNGQPAFPRNDAVQANGFTMDVGMALKAGEVISLGLVAYNITNTGSLYAPVQLGGGISALVKKMFMVELDALADFTSYPKTEMELQAGLEFILKEQFSFRGGYCRDFHFGVNSYSLGFGYTAKRFAIDLGYRQDIEFIERVRIALGFRIFLG